MAGIFVYNKKIENHDGEKNNYIITRPSILSNPYTHEPLERTQARYRVKNRDAAIEKYDHYFDVMYGGDKEFKSLIDQMYEQYKNGEDIYLGCVCKPLPCHGDVIAKKLTSRLVKENFLNIRKKFG
jgi:hypothetical protein